MGCIVAVGGMGQMDRVLLENNWKKGRDDYYAECVCSEPNRAQELPLVQSYVE